MIRVRVVVVEGLAAVDGTVRKIENLAGDEMNFSVKDREEAKSDILN